jgi:hypothetical protein
MLLPAARTDPCFRFRNFFEDAAYPQRRADGSPSKFTVDPRSMLAKVASECYLSSEVPPGDGGRHRDRCNDYSLRHYRGHS